MAITWFLLGLCNLISEGGMNFQSWVSQNPLFRPIKIYLKLNSFTAKLLITHKFTQKTFDRTLKELSNGMFIHSLRQ